MTETKKKILVIDDSIDGQILLTMLLEASGYEVQCTSNGKDALALLRMVSDLPDLILLDSQMPVMNGYEFRLEQRLDSRLQNIPVVVMTADCDLDLDEKMFFPLNILHKPLQIKSFMTKISSYLSVGGALELNPSFSS